MRVLVALAVVGCLACGGADEDTPASTVQLPPSTGLVDPGDMSSSATLPTPPTTAAPATATATDGSESPHSPAPPSPSATTGTLTLYVSNQSFADDPVGITVSIAGQLVVDDVFFVEGQHNWVGFELQIPSGDRQVTMTSSTGVTRHATVSIPADEQRWAVADYWYYPPDRQHPNAGQTPRSFTFTVDDEPIYFA